MHEVREIEENLRTIRRLMERGERYEAITGGGSLAAGLLACVVGAGLALLRVGAEAPARAQASGFVGAWAAVAVACACGVALRAILGTEDRRVSAQARAIGRSVGPAYLAAIILTTVLVLHDLAWLLPGCWMLLHGVAILSTSYHATSRLILLGWAFLVAGAATAWLAASRTSVGELHALMAAGFGGLHLAYGLLCLARPLPRED